MAWHGHELGVGVASVQSFSPSFDFWSLGPFLPTTRTYAGSSFVSEMTFSWNRSANSVCSMSRAFISRALLVKPGGIDPFGATASISYLASNERIQGGPPDSRTD